jgi:hypothetical protein
MKSALDTEDTENSATEAAERTGRSNSMLESGI